MPSQQPKVSIAVAWYFPEQWERLREVVADPQNFEETHAEWQASFDSGMLFFKDRGFDAHRVPVDVDELTAWCQKHSRPMDGKAGLDFAAEKLRAEFQGR